MVLLVVALVLTIGLMVYFVFVIRDVVCICAGNMHGPRSSKEHAITIMDDDIQFIWVQNWPYISSGLFFFFLLLYET